MRPDGGIDVVDWRILLASLEKSKVLGEELTGWIDLIYVDKRRKPNQVDNANAIE